MSPIPYYVTSASLLTLLALGFAATIVTVGRSYDRPHLRAWRASWILLATYALFSILALLASREPALRTVRPFFSVVSLLAGWAHLFYVHEGMWRLCRPTRPLPAWRRWVPGLALVAAIALVFLPMDPMQRYMIRVAVLSLTWGITYLATGLMILRDSPALSRLGRHALGGALLSYGAVRVIEPTTFWAPQNPVLEQLVVFGGLPFIVAMGAGMLISLLDGERQDALRAADERLSALSDARASEATLAAALESSSEVVCVLDRDRRLMTFNRPFIDLVEKAREVTPLVGMLVDGLTQEERRSSWAQMHRDALKGIAQDFQEPVSGPDREPRRMMTFRVSPVRRDGVIESVLVMGRDVTDEELLRDEIARREERFRSLIENSSDIIFMVTREGHFIYSSPAITRVLGWDPAVLTGRNGFEFVHPEDLEVVRGAFERGFANALQGTVTPFRARASNGEFVRLEAVARPFAERDGTPRLIVAARDVRERVRLETELLAARRMETVGRLAGGVAHDFNNLLTAILGNVTLARGAIATTDPLRGDLDEIEHSAMRGAELTRRLLAFARRQMIEPRTLDLGEAVGGLERLLTRLIGEDVHLLLEPERELWPVKADPTALEQALVNLAVNARDAMPSGGRLTIRTANHRSVEGGTLELPTGDWVRVDIIDTGIGIDDRTLPHIFEPFFTTKGQIGGTGLGLATVYGIVTQAGGQVRVRSAPGAGTTFSLFFPRTAPSRASGEERARRDALQPPRAAGETVLLIEDEESVRNVTGRLLRDLGYHVLLADDGATGVEVAASHDGRIHAVVSDLVMPHLGGAEAVARIRVERPELGVVFMSGFSEEALSWRGAMPEGGRFLTKPFSPLDLARAVRGVLDELGG